MPAPVLDSLASLIAGDGAAFSEDKKSAVLDYLTLMLNHDKAVDAEDGDAAWEKLLSDPGKTERFAVWAAEALKEEPAEPLDLARL